MSMRLMTFAIVLLGLIPGCARGGGEEEPRPTIDPEEASKLVPSTLDMTVDGEISFEYSDEVDLRVVVIDEPGLEQVRFLSVGLQEFQNLDDSRRFRMAFDLVGVYDGPGRYELPKAGGSRTIAPKASTEEDAESIAQGLSRPILIYYELDPGAQTPGPDSVTNSHQFDNLIEPCDLVVGDKGKTGMLSCPEVADASGSTVSLEMRWEPRP